MLRSISLIPGALTVLLLAGCGLDGREAPTLLRSPSGAWDVRVYESEFGDFTHLAGIVYLDLMDAKGRKIDSQRTEASTNSRWAVGWLIGTDTLVLNSRDIGVRAWWCDGSGFTEVGLDSAVQRTAEEILQTKYGQ
jgi:hypothetical protein